MNNILRASSKSTDPTIAIKEIAERLNAKECNFAIIFFSSSYDEALIQKNVSMHFGRRAVAISTAGEISESGEYLKSGASGVSFVGPQFQIRPVLVNNHTALDEKGLSEVKSQVDQVQSIRSINGAPAKTFCLLFIDGLSGAEEEVTEAIGNQLGGIPLVGGSSGDDLKFIKTSMCFGSEIYRNSAMLIFITTSIPFEIFKTQHFSVSTQKLVITESDVTKRLVTEINGLPAAQAYAEVLGLEEKDLNSEIFSKHPLILKIADDYYVRSIQKVNPDSSFTFFCAIETGLVLSIAKNDGIVSMTEKALNGVEKNLGSLECSLLFECILRRLEVLQLDEDSRNALYKVYGKHNSIGFHTYGEQKGPLHINQTLTGVAFGK